MIPVFGSLESTSRVIEEDQGYQIGDIIIIACETAEDSFHETHTFTCGINATWVPDIHQTLPSQCYLVRTSHICVIIRFWSLSL
mgnify:FL=1